MKKLLILLLVAASFSGIAQTKVSATIVPNSPLDKGYATTDAATQKGGFHTFLSNADRDTMPNAYKTVGMFASTPTGLYVLSNDLTTWNVAPNGLPVQVFYLSKYGAISDANVADGSTTFGTDNTTAIQAVLNIAATGQPILVYVDGQFSVTGLKIYSNTTLDGVNKANGLIIRNNSNKALINGNAVTALGTRDSNIIIKNMTCNFNSYNNGNSVQTHDNSTEGWVTGIRIFHAANIEISNCNLLRSTTFTTQMADCQYVFLNNNYINVGINAVEPNADGFHFNGFCNHLILNGNSIMAHDDHIGINADDGFGFDPSATNASLPIYGSLATNWLNGPITDVTISNTTFLEGGYYGLRILSGNSRVDRISINNIHGITSDYWFVMDNYAQNPSTIGGGNGNVGTVLIDGVNVVTPTNQKPYGIAGQVMVATNFDNLTLNNISRTNFAIGQSSFVFYHNHKGGVVNIGNYFAIDSSNLNIAHMQVDSFVIGSLNINNVNISNTQGGKTSHFLAFLDGGKSLSRPVITGKLKGFGYTFIYPDSIKSRIDMRNLYEGNGYDTTTALPTAAFNFMQSNGDAVDISGNGNTLTNNGGVTYMSSRANFSSSQTGRYLSGVVPRADTGFTISFKLNISNFNTLASASFLVAKGLDNNNQYEYGVYLFNSDPYKGQLHFIIAGGGDISLPQRFAVGVDYNITVSYHKGVQLIYVNGLAVQGMTTGKTTLNSSSYPFCIGGTAGSPSFNGSISNLSYYNYNLSDGQIASLAPLASTFNYSSSSAN